MKSLNSNSLVVLILFLILPQLVIKTDEQLSRHLIYPKEYQTLLKKGMDVDWCKTKKGIEYYREKEVVDIKKKGFSHVRIRVKADADKALLKHIDRVVNDCLKNGLIPVLAYQAKEFKAHPNDQTMAHAVKWWQIVSKHYSKYSYLLSFDLIIEVTDQLNKNNRKLNEFYEKAVALIRQTNPRRILFISPVYRSSPSYLKELKIPSQGNGFLMAEWHFYASGPSTTNSKKLWTKGTKKQKLLIINKIEQAYKWQQRTGIYTWVGAWMPGNYNKGNSYSLAQQQKFASFMSCQLSKYHIPFAVNSSTKFYDRQTYQWIQSKEAVLNAILHPNCDDN